MWTKILRGVDDEVKGLIDHESVELLLGLAPGLSQDDLRHLTDLMCSKKFLPRVQDRMQRDQLQRNLSRLQTMIPTLHGVINNLKQLAPACEIMKRLTDGVSRQTIRESFMSSYQRHAHAAAEYGEGTMRPCEWESADAQREFLYVQVWTACLREFLYLSPYAPLKERGRPKPEVRRINPAMEQRLGALAVRSGFCTSTAQSWSARDRQVCLAEHFREDVEIGLGDTDADVIAALALAMKQVRPRRIPAGPVKFFDNQDFERERRVGRPFEKDYHADRSTYFLLPLLQRHQDLSTQESHVTSSFARWSLLNEFFLWDLPESDELIPSRVLDNEELMPDASTHEEPSSLSNPARSHEVWRAQNDTLTRRIAELESQLSTERLSLARERSQSSSQLATLRQTLEAEKDSAAERAQIEIRNQEVANSSLREALKRAQLQATDREASMDRLEKAITEKTQALERVQIQARNQEGAVENGTSLENLEQIIMEKNQALERILHLEKTALAASAESNTVDQLTTALRDANAEIQTIPDLKAQIQLLEQEVGDLREAQGALEGTDGNEEEFELRAEAEQKDQLQEVYAEARTIIAMMTETDGRDDSHEHDPMATIQRLAQDASNRIRDLQEQLLQALASIATLKGEEKALKEEFARLKAEEVTILAGRATAEETLASLRHRLDQLDSQKTTVEMKDLEPPAGFRDRLQSLQSLLITVQSFRSIDPDYFYIHCSNDEHRFQTFHFERTLIEPVINMLQEAMGNQGAVRARNRGAKRSKTLMCIRNNDMKTIVATDTLTLRSASLATRGFWISSCEPLSPTTHAQIIDPTQDAPSELPRGPETRKRGYAASSSD